MGGKRAAKDCSAAAATDAERQAFGHNDGVRGRGRSAWPKTTEPLRPAPRLDGYAKGMPKRLREMKKQERRVVEECCAHCWHRLAHQRRYEGCREVQSVTAGRAAGHKEDPVSQPPRLLLGISNGGRAGRYRTFLTRRHRSAGPCFAAGHQRCAGCWLLARCLSAAAPRPAGTIDCCLRQLRCRMGVCLCRLARAGC